MTGRWITVSLVALALAGCHKKEAAKPPPPKVETPAPPTAPAVVPATPPAESTTTTSTTPPPTPEPVVETPVAPTPATEPTPPKPAGVRPPIRIVPSAGLGKTPMVIKKTQLQLAAETNVLGAWVQQDKKTSILRFTPSGWVSLEKGNQVINGKWTANSAGAINFTLPVPGGEAKLVAHYADTKATGRYIVVIPNQDGPQIWPGYGQLIFSPQK
ncbi:hypothetical protein ASD21_01710 [Caulobacter sp. Root1455]|jgi:hypothetical protein|uniref:hypothetical protein n=1 Tax=Caulobacter sp. Root1455 TaxID=1736465 RepID=UPI0006FCAD92|nr:hypothetical protein [Caulobacter sp. Root1455]KQZ06373.1 hypothetical protein ASD21_01710 [Caulobacter sp. Root1455]